MWCHGWWHVCVTVGKKLHQKGDSEVAPEDGHVDGHSDGSGGPLEPSRHADDELWWHCVCRTAIDWVPVSWDWSWLDHVTGIPVWTDAVKRSRCILASLSFVRLLYRSNYHDDDDDDHRALLLSWCRQQLCRIGAMCAVGRAALNILVGWAKTQFFRSIFGPCFWYFCLS